MGVYISNETMPEDCYTCFCYETEFNMCSLTGKRLDNIRIRQDDCPLIEIPTPHGRLIDASELIKSYMKGTKTDIDDFYDTIDIIDNAPTILEEEP